MKANTKLDGFALMLIMPKESYDAANSDRIFRGKLIFHSAQSGVMSLDKVRYSGNSIELDIGRFAE